MPHWTICWCECGCDVDRRRGDIYDKDAARFLDLATRLRLFDGTGLRTVSVRHRGRVTIVALGAMIGRGAFDMIEEGAGS